MPQAPSPESKPPSSANSITRGSELDLEDEPPPPSSMFETAPVDEAHREIESPSAQDNVDTSYPQPPSAAWFAEVEDPIRVPYEEEPRFKAPPIERWEDLSCIRFLNRFRNNGGVNDRGYKILYRMCQLIWAIGHEVEIRKKVKLARAQRLAKFQAFCNALYQGAKLWQKNMKNQILHVTKLASSLPVLHTVTAFQDLGPKLNEWHEAIKGLYRPDLQDFKLFSRILEHYRLNYRVLYGIHRQKPDYGLRNVLPTADKVFKLLIKLPGYALEADEMIMEFEIYFWQNVDRYYKDRTRQEKDVADFDGISVEEKLKGFKTYMQLFQPSFIKEVNSGTASQMLQEAFNEHLERFRIDFLRTVAKSIKLNRFQVDVDNPHFLELERMQEEAQQYRDAQEAMNGWIEALGQDPKALDDDDQELLEMVAMMDEVVGKPLPPLPAHSKLAHLLRIQDYRQLQLQGVIAWDHSPLPRRHRTSSTLANSQGLHSREQPTETPQANPPGVPAKDWDRSLGEIEATQSARADFLRSQEHFLFGDKLSREGLTPTPGQPGRNERISRLPLHISTSFAIAEDDLAVRGHHRSSTVPDANYVAGSGNDSDSPPPPAAFFHGRATRRHGVHVPRIFTGSFSQLETDVRKLQLHKFKTPEAQPNLERSHTHDSKIRDFAITPQLSPSATPSPATLLFRREALLSRDTELQHRVINGETIRTRRPSTKTRAQTVDETTRGLETWLSNDQARGDSPTLALRTPPRPERKHTI